MKITFLTQEEYVVQDIRINGLHNQKFCVFDLEGTGINFETDHITQIGAVILHNGLLLRSCLELETSVKCRREGFEDRTLLFEKG